MRRREFIGGVGAAAVFGGRAAWAQSVPSIGFLGTASESLYEERLRAFRHSLAEGGFKESETVAIEFRWANGRYDQLSALAADLVERQVEVIAATSTPA